MKKNENCSYRKCGRKVATLYFVFDTTFGGKCTVASTCAPLVPGFPSSPWWCWCGGLKKMRRSRAISGRRKEDERQHDRRRRRSDCEEEERERRQRQWTSETSRQAMRTRLSGVSPPVRVCACGRQFASDLLLGRLVLLQQRGILVLLVVQRRQLQADRLVRHAAHGGCTGVVGLASAAGEQVDTLRRVGLRTALTLERS